MIIRTSSILIKSRRNCSKSHNINQQMNYWHVFNSNLTELFESYVDFNEAFRQAAQNNADKYLESISAPNRKPCGLGENGWTLGTGVWPYSLDVRSAHSGPGTGAFTTLLFWDYYLFTQNKEILQKNVYPAIAGMAKFLSLVLVEHNGYMLSKPSASPEQMQKKKYYETIGCAFDQQMIYENAKNTIEAAKILQINEPIIATLKKQINRLDPVQIGASGQIKEFREENKYGQIGERFHRHISQLVGLYPGTLISRENQQWIKAAKKTLRLRGNRSTGWAMAHRMNAWARTGDGRHSYKLLKMMLRWNTMPNLWDTHPPFQIDGNFGASAGITEMLIQSHEGIIRVLPALPPKWKNGAYSGLCARGGFEIDAVWRNSRIINLKIRAKCENVCKFLVQECRIKSIKCDNQFCEFDNANNIFWFDAKKGKEYFVEFF